MARGIGEDPRKSPSALVGQIDFPATRAEIVETAEDSEAPIEVINFFKSLPKESYASQEELLRDFSEAQRRFGMGGVGDAGRHRENLGRPSAEDASEPRHP